MKPKPKCGEFIFIHSQTVFEFDAVTMCFSNDSHEFMSAASVHSRNLWSSLTTDVNKSMNSLQGISEQ